MSKICKNVVNLPTNQNYNLIGVEPEKTKETEPKTAATATNFKYRIKEGEEEGKILSYEGMLNYIGDYRKRWTPEFKYFSDEFTKKLRCIIYYIINNKDFDNFYWYCYNTGKQYLKALLQYKYDDGVTPYYLDLNTEWKKWIKKYEKEYPNLPPESQALITEQYNKQIQLYKRFNVSPSFNKQRD